MIQTVWIIFQDECHNFIKVLLKKNDDALFVCGTNAFNPSCRNYKVNAICRLEPHCQEAFHNLLWLYLQQPKRGNSTPPEFLSLVQLNVLLHMSDPEQASKLPVCWGLIDTFLKSLPSKVSFCKTLFSIVQKTDILTMYTMWITFLYFFSLLPHYLTSEHKSTLIWWVISILKGISKACHLKL